MDPRRIPLTVVEPQIASKNKCARFSVGWLWSEFPMGWEAVTTKDVLNEIDQAGLLIPELKNWKPSPFKMDISLSNEEREKYVENNPSIFPRKMTTDQFRIYPIIEDMLNRTKTHVDGFVGAKLLQNSSLEEPPQCPMISSHMDCKCK